MYTNLKILVVEDHDALRLMMVQHLNSQGFHAEGVDSGESVNDYLASARIDVMVLDLTLPIEDGLSIAKRIRQVYPEIHIIMLTARISEMDRVKGYESGADVYLSKPVSIPELEASIGSFARRKASTSSEKIFWLDSIEMTLKNDQITLELTRQETILLKTLAEAPMQFAPAWALLERLGKDTDTKSRATLDVAIARLRKKISSAIEHEGAIRVARGSGYQLTLKINLR